MASFLLSCVRGDWGLGIEIDEAVFLEAVEESDRSGRRSEEESVLSSPSFLFLDENKS